jgi:hypothetical protein
MSRSRTRSTDTTSRNRFCDGISGGEGTGLFDAQIGQSISGRHPRAARYVRAAAIEGSVDFPRRRHVLVVPGAPSVGTDSTCAAWQIERPH